MASNMESRAQMQDEFALRSQQFADAAYKAGRIQEELAPVPLRNSKVKLTGEHLDRG